MFLNTLKPGQQAIVTAIHAEQALHQRLTALGFRPGKVLQVMRQASFNGPLHIRIGTTDVMIRLQDAVCIELQTRQTTSIAA